jgi:hypothetical protein
MPYRCASLLDVGQLLTDGAWMGVGVSHLARDTEESEGDMTQALLLNQLAQLENPDHRIVLEGGTSGKLLGAYAEGVQGLATSDDAQFVRCFWDVLAVANGWVPLAGPVTESQPYGGRENVLLWEGGTGRYYRHAQGLKAVGRLGGWKSGSAAWKRLGVSVSQMRELPVTIYTGDMFDHAHHVIVAKDTANLAAIWTFCLSDQFQKSVRKIDQKLSVTNATLVKVPFDLERWQRVAQERYPDGLPEPHSDDPTQWLFRGDIPSSTAPLHVAMARLLGYAWPDPLDDGLNHLLDADGIVTLTPLVNQEGVANRLRALLQAAYESPAPPRPKGAPEVAEPRVWDETTLPRLLAQAGCAGLSLEEWLRDKFFESHCKLFHHRPFIWHLWDGRKDGFHAFVNYHKLDSRNLERLTHVYLGEWIERQKAALESGDRTADARLIAAQTLQQKLELIRTGEPPYDIFVRWKSLAEQPLGWDPDLNDGVRMNIRPFVEAGILRGKVNVNWNKDRGKDPKPNVSGTVERHNDLHFTLAEKRAAREAER